jgi:hypothetical protein
MSTISHKPSAGVRDERRWAWLLEATEMWASIAISMIWLAVMFAAVWGPDIVDATPGGSSSTVPSGVVVALAACIATWAVAKYGFGQRRS